MGVASKIPVRGGETGGERSLRSDHQRRPEIHVGAVLGKNKKRTFFGYFAEVRFRVFPPDFCRPLTSVRFRRMAGELEAIP
jgi:hypothetical protein